MSRVFLLALTAAVAACSSKAPRAGDSATAAAPTKREIHEGIASSRLPGARGVGGALKVSDSADARAAAIDAASETP